MSVCIYFIFSFFFAIASHLIRFLSKRSLSILFFLTFSLFFFPAARYGAPIVVTENGCDVPGESELPLKEALSDTFRVKYLNVEFLFYFFFLLFLLFYSFCFPFFISSFFARIICIMPLSQLKKIMPTWLDTFCGLLWITLRFFFLSSL